MDLQERIFTAEMRHWLSSTGIQHQDDPSMNFRAGTLGGERKVLAVELAENPYREGVFIELRKRFEKTELGTPKELTDLLALGTNLVDPDSRMGRRTRWPKDKQQHLPIADYNELEGKLFWALRNMQGMVIKNALCDTQENTSDSNPATFRPDLPEYLAANDEELDAQPLIFVIHPSVLDTDSLMPIGLHPNGAVVRLDYDALSNISAEETLILEADTLDGEEPLSGGRHNALYHKFLNLSFAQEYIVFSDFLLGGNVRTAVENKALNRARLAATKDRFGQPNMGHNLG